MKYYFTCIFSLFLPFLTLASDGERAKEMPVKIKLTKSFCQKFIIEHKAQNNVAYKAGVDVDGNALVPADINAVSVPLPTKIRIPVTIQKQYILSMQSSGTIASSNSGNIDQSGIGTFTTKGIIKSPYVDEIPLGFVEYDLKTGKMNYNGKSFSSKEKVLLKQKCKNILKSPEK